MENPMYWLFLCTGAHMEIIAYTTCAPRGGQGKVSPPDFGQKGDKGSLAAKKNPLSDKAYKLYKGGMKLIDIAAKLKLPPGTVRRWKSVYDWEGERSDKNSERSDKTSAKKNVHIDDGTKETLRNEELTAGQQMFCIYYSRTFNAAQSYQKAYGCSYHSAMVEGSKFLRKPKVREEIERLKELKRQQIMISENDIVELQMRIACADIGDYTSFGREEVPVMGPFGPITEKNPDTGEKEALTKEVNTIRLKESGNVDTQIIQEVKQGREGVSIKLADKQKAIDWLTKYFLIHPESRYRAEYERRRAEKEGGEVQEFESDGFLEALKGDAAATFERDDIIET